jgi:hypothetical protein
MPPETFLKIYEQVLASQQWEKVAPLLDFLLATMFLMSPC